MCSVGVYCMVSGVFIGIRCYFVGQEFFSCVFWVLEVISFCGVKFLFYSQVVGLSCIFLSSVYFFRTQRQRGVGVYLWVLLVVMLLLSQGSIWRKVRKEVRGWVLVRGGSWQYLLIICNRVWIRMFAVEVSQGGDEVRRGFFQQYRDLRGARREGGYILVLQFIGWCRWNCFRFGSYCIYCIGCFIFFGEFVLCCFLVKVLFFIVVIVFYSWNVCRVMFLGGQFYGYILFLLKIFFFYVEFLYGGVMEKKF